MPADPMDDVRAAGYRRIVRELSRAGYDWYEVSNFALPGRRARHNVAYWRARPVPRPRTGRREHRRRPALDERGRPGRLGGGPRGRRRRRRARPRRSTPGTRARERLLLAARCGERVPLAEVAAVVDPQARRRASRRLDWFPCTVVQSA